VSDDVLTSERGKVMLSNCPRYYDTSRVFKSHLQTSGEELDGLKQGINEILDQFFVPTSTWGLDRWEEELGLESYADKPYEQRRSQIISKIRGIGTVTIQLIQNVAEAYDGGSVEVEDHPETYSFIVRFIDTRGVPENLDDLKNTIEEIKPAHLNVEYKFRYLIWDELDNINTTWDSLDAHLYSWDQLEVLDPATY